MIQSIFGLSGWYIGAVLLVVVWMALLYTKRQPEVSSMREFVGLLNSRGGVILVLMGLAVYFFRTGIELFYFILSQLRDGKLTEQNAIALMALQFVTGTAFGGAFGALLSVMTGGDSRSRAVDGRPPGTPNNVVSSPDSPAVKVTNGGGGAPASTPPPQPGGTTVGS